MFPWLTANRAAAITGALIGIAAFITGNLGALPKGWENTAVAIAGLLITAAHLITYLIGAIHWQATPAGQAQAIIPASTADPSGVKLGGPGGV